MLEGSPYLPRGQGATHIRECAGAAFHGDVRLLPARVLPVEPLPELLPRAAAGRHREAVQHLGALLARVGAAAGCGAAPPAALPDEVVPKDLRAPLAVVGPAVPATEHVLAYSFSRDYHRDCPADCAVPVALEPLPHLAPSTRLACPPAALAAGFGGLKIWGVLQRARKRVSL